MWEAASSAGELLASPPSAVLQRAETAAMSSLSLSPSRRNRAGGARLRGRGSRKRESRPPGIPRDQASRLPAGVAYIGDGCESSW